MATRTKQEIPITGIILGLHANRTVTLPCRSWRSVARSFDTATAELIAAFCAGRNDTDPVSIACDAESAATVDRALAGGRR